MATHFEIIRTYIQEHGQETGSVSWQMALQSLELLNEDYQVAMRLLEERQRLLDKEDLTLEK